MKNLRQIKEGILETRHFDDIKANTWKKIGCKIRKLTDLVSLEYLRNII